MHSWLKYVNIYKENYAEQNIIKNKKINKYFPFFYKFISSLFKMYSLNEIEQKTGFLFKFILRIHYKTDKINL